jgi:hypothetical protein
MQMPENAISLCERRGSRHGDGERPVKQING